LLYLIGQSGGEKKRGKKKEKEEAMTDQERNYSILISFIRGRKGQLENFFDLRKRL